MTQVELNLPDDLKSALNQAQIQYKAVDLTSARDVRREGGFLRLIPQPGANESWAAGGKVVFTYGPTESESFSGEVIEYSPDDGAIYVDVPDLEALADPSLLKLRYEPFDYSGALIGAFDRLRNHPQLLSPALDRVCGYDLEAAGSSEPQPHGAQAPSPQVDGITPYWDKAWSILWGPPGTGKTHNVSRALAAHAANPSAGKILVVTPTNLAADEVAFRLCTLLSEQKLLNSQGHCAVYRGGRSVGDRLSSTFPDCLRDSAYAELYDGTKRQLVFLERAQDAARREKNVIKAAELQKQINALRADLPDETAFAVASGKAKVIVLTTFKAFRFAGNGDPPCIFTKVVLDEAGMISRVTAAALSTLGKSVLLAGDPKQIGPIFISPRGLSKEVRKWLLESALGHLTTPKAIPLGGHVHFLDTQYRMHPDISAAVSAFTYDGALQDSPQARNLAKEPPRTATLPSRRAAYVVVDDVASKPEEACARKANVGTGYERGLSARIAISLAQAAAGASDGVLVLTPYRAQVRVLRNLAKEAKHSEKISIGTIHRNQGTERDVVIVDLVRGALSWSDSEIATLLNVAVSRAKRHFVLIASNAELTTPVVSRLAASLSKERLSQEILEGGAEQRLLDFGDTTPEPSTSETPAEPLSPTATLGDEIRGLARRLPLFSADQMRLCERNIGEGHYLVRGVAGSGKSVILAHWAARLIQRRPQYGILVTFFNKGMYNLLRTMIRDACKRLGMDPTLADSRITLSHVSRVEDRQQYDAVFVDEAQDMESDQLKKLYELCRTQRTDEGRELRNLILFSDDSQNIYGRQSLEELKAKLPDEFAFSGRSFVLRETHRSTQSILSFAINLALDPKKVLSDEEAGLLQFMKVAELSKEGLLVRPEDSTDGLYHVRYTERLGIEPRVVTCDNQWKVLDELTREIKVLIDRERVRPGDIMVVAAKQPNRMQEALQRAGIRATAYGGRQGQDPIGMPARDPDHVRCTTVFTCKGHEAPVVFFVNTQEVDSAEDFITGKSPQELKKMKRCMLYVGSSRAMMRQYVYGTECASMRAAHEYSKVEATVPGLL